MDGGHAEPETVSAATAEPFLGHRVRGMLGRWTSGRRAFITAAGIFLVLTAVFFSPIVRNDATFSLVAGHQAVIWPWAAHPTGYSDAYPQSDAADTIYPWSVFAAQVYRHGEIPLWNPYSFGGTPFLTNGLGMSLYPLRVSMLSLVSPIWTHDLLLILHVFGSGLAMFALLRVLRASFLAAIMSGISWMFSSYLFAWIQLEYVVVLGVCLPLSLLLVRLASDRRSWWSAIAAGGILGLATLGTGLQLAGPLALTVGAYACALAVRDFLGGLSATGTRRREIAGAILRPVLMGLTAVGIAAPVALPTLMLSRQLGRNPIPLDVLEESAVPLRVFLRAALPPQTPPTEALLNGGAVFVGTASVGLALVGLISRRPGWVLGAAIAFGTLLVCTGTPLDVIPYEIVPGFQYLTRLGRMLVFWSFGVALLAGLGLDALLRLSSRQRRRSRPTALACVLAGVCIVSVAYQTMTVARALNPPFQPRDYRYLYPRTPAIAALTADRDQRRAIQPQRILPLRVNAPALYASHAMLFGIESGAGYESVVMSRTADIWRVVAGESVAAVSASPLASSFIPSYSPSKVRYDLLPRVGITTIYAPPDVSSDPVWRQRRASPLSLQQLYSGPDGSVFTIRSAGSRGFVVYRAKRVEDAAAALASYTTPGFPYRTTVLLEGNAGDTARSHLATPAPATPVHRGVNSSEWIVQARQPGYFVLLDTWAPGWRATVNGEPIAVQRADYAFRAVAVPAGRSVVRLDYHPPGFGAGLLAITATLLGIVGGVFVFIVRLSRQRGLSGHDAEVSGSSLG